MSHDDYITTLSTLTEHFNVDLLYSDLSTIIYIILTYLRTNHLTFSS